MSESTIHCQMIGANAALLEIDNPPANALGSAMRRIFVERLDTLEADPAIRAIVITGKGRSFCSGDDLKEQEAAQSAGLAARQEQLASFYQVLERVERVRVPVIAAINGWCMGGGLELALCADIRIASTEASFVCSGVNVGLMASPYRLPRLIGVARAKHMLLTGLPFDAEAAERFGLVTAVHKPDMLLEQATELAERIASRAPLSVEATKRVASRANDLSPEEAAIVIRDELTVLVQSADHADALAAFREKRVPIFTKR